MKTIKNKITEIKENDKNLDYKALILFCINEAKVDGFTLQEMRERIRLIDKVEASNGKIELEDADAQKVKELVLKKKWPVMHKSILKFSDEISDSL